MSGQPFNIETTVVYDSDGLVCSVRHEWDTVAPGGQTIRYSVSWSVSAEGGSLRCVSASFYPDGSAWEPHQASTGHSGPLEDRIHRHPMAKGGAA